MTTMPTMKEVLLYLIKCGPGRTEAQLAQAIFDSAGYQQHVTGNCLLLINRGSLRDGEVEGNMTHTATFPFSE